MTLPTSYFDELYAASPDPWGFTDRWYERRKRALTLALLPAPRYASAYEPGCSIGVLTVGLAARCDRLLATDVSAAAVAAARERCADLPGVRVEQATLPQDWPSSPVELAVLSELGYYFDEAGARRVADLAVTAGTVVAVHWRREVGDYPLRGDEVHAILAESASRQGLHRLGGYRDDDLTAEVWTRDGRSVATAGGLS